MGKSITTEQAEEKEVIKYIIKMVHMFNHWLSKYYTTTAFNWETLPNQIMGLLESKPASLPSSQVSTESSSASEQERFKEEVRKSAENFKNLVMRNKVMMFSATYYSYCTVAKVSRSSVLRPSLSVICSEVIRGPRNSVPELRGQQGGRGRPDDGDTEPVLRRRRQLQPV